MIVAFDRFSNSIFLLSGFLILSSKTRFSGLAPIVGSYPSLANCVLASDDSTSVIFDSFSSNRSFVSLTQRSTISNISSSDNLLNSITASSLFLNSGVKNLLTALFCSPFLV